jgi:type VI secretion system protein ImpG
VESLLKLELRTISNTLRFGQLTLDKLRLFLKGQSQHVYTLYELMLNDAVELALATSPDDPQAIRLPVSALQPVGFARDEALLPYSARSQPAYRLLTEFFAFPEKFLFVDLAGLAGRLTRFGNRLEIYIGLKRSLRDLERNVSRDTFRLGCTPMVNLFERRAEPIQLTQRQPEYHVLPDARRPQAFEVYSIDRVTATSPGGEVEEYRPFYSFKHGSDERQTQVFWHAVRRPAEPYEGQVDDGTEVFLSLVDLAFSPAAAADWTLDVVLTCVNRDLPPHLPFGGGQPRLQLTAGGPLKPVVCLTQPTATRRPALKRGALWRLISHLSLNHLSLEDVEDGAHALREILKLYDVADSPETRYMIDGVRSVRSRRVVGRAGGTISGGFCRGVEVTVGFDEDHFAGNGVFLFACLLERFLGLWSSINSFSKMIAVSKQREGELRRWSPRAGEKSLL